MEDDKNKTNKIAVFLDTNQVRNSSINSLFGRIEELKELSEFATIFLPKVVLDEIMRQKERWYYSKYNDLVKNPLFQMLKEEASDISSFTDIKKQVENDVSVPYEIWDISDRNYAFKGIYELAISNKAPFDKGSDKGFKDACIAFTVLDFLDNSEDYKTVILITEDSRLQDFFSTVNEVEIFESINDLINHHEREKECQEDYFEKKCDNDQKLRNEISAGSNKVPHDIDLPTLIDQLRYSDSFQKTHSIIRKLSLYQNTIDRNDAVRILNISVKNQQVSWVIGDEDVLAFLQPLFEKYGDSLSLEDYSTFVDAAGFFNDRTDSMGNFIFSRSENRIYNAFVDQLVSHIQSRDFLSSYEADVGKILLCLKSTLALATLDEKAANWNLLTGAFIIGKYTASSMPINKKTLSEFINYFESISEEKQEAVIHAIGKRLDEIDVDYDIQF